MWRPTPTLAGHPDAVTAGWNGPAGPPCIEGAPVNDSLFHRDTYRNMERVINMADRPDHTGVRIQLEVGHQVYFCA